MMTETNDAAMRSTPRPDSAAPLFIVGTPRSGSTLLASLLGAHSGLYCGPETHAYSKFEPLFGMPGEPWRDDDDWARLQQTWQREGLNGTSLFTLFDVDRDQLRADFAHHGFNVRSLLVSVLGAACRRQGKRRWVEKTPNHSLHLPEIFADFPDARIIWILRDPRDSALSMAKLPTAPRTLVGRCLLVREWLELLQAAASDPRVNTVRYEALAQDPRSTLKSLCAWIGEGFEEEMLRAAERSHNVAAPGEWWKNDVKGAITAARCGAWATQTTAKERDILEAFLTPVCAKLGYDVGSAADRQVCHIPLPNRAERAILEALLRIGHPKELNFEIVNRPGLWAKVKLAATLIKRGIARAKSGPQVRRTKVEPP